MGLDMRSPGIYHRVSPNIISETTLGFSILLTPP
jgi:hypothetical protein